MRLLTEGKGDFRIHNPSSDTMPVLVTYACDPDSLAMIAPCALYSDCRPDDMLKAIGRGDLVKPDRQEAQQ